MFADDLRAKFWHLMSGLRHLQNVMTLASAVPHGLQVADPFHIAPDPLLKSKFTDEKITVESKN